MKKLKLTLAKLIAKVRHYSPFHAPKRPAEERQMDDVARWADEGGAGGDPRRTI